MKPGTITLADLQRAIALQARLDLLDELRAEIIDELEQLGIDTSEFEFEYPAGRSGTAREAPSTGMRDGTAPAAVQTPPVTSIGVQPAARHAILVEPAPPSAPQLTEAEINERAVKAVLTAAYASWQRGEISDEDFNGRKQRYATEIRQAMDEIRRGEQANAPCTICGDPSDVIVMGDAFCKAHRPKPLSVVAA